jgi:hypothetical protein
MVKIRNTKERRSWLAGLKPGDRVIKYDATDGEPLDYQIVSKVDDGWVWFGWVTYYRKNGYDTEGDGAFIGPPNPRDVALVGLRWIGHTGNEPSFTDEQIVSAAAILWPHGYQPR